MCVYSGLSDSFGRIGALPRGGSMVIALLLRDSYRTYSVCVSCNRNFRLGSCERGMEEYRVRPRSSNKND